ncbi:DJ-1/PfpI family protein [bacterium]|nr:DJ-1/PfpI family protein [bacterium]
MPQITVLIAQGFEEMEVVTPVDIWRRAGIEVSLMSVEDKVVVKGSRDISLVTDELYDSEKLKKTDLLFIPGGKQGVLNLCLNSSVLSDIKKRCDSGNEVAAICAGTIVLLKAGVLNSQKITSHPSVEEELVKSGLDYSEERVVKDQNIWTSRGPGSASDFAFEYVSQTVSKELATEISEAMVF